MKKTPLILLLSLCILTLTAACSENSIVTRTMISAGGSHIVGLKADGTVVAAGDNSEGQCNVSKWKNIIAVAVGGNYTVGLKADGTVVAVGNNKSGQCNVSEWKDIVTISAGYDHTVGLKADGTVAAVGNSIKGQCNLAGWKDIVAVSAGTWYTIGLKADGTVVAAGNNDLGQCVVSDWKDIIAVSAGPYYPIGLKADGTIVVSFMASRLYDESVWKNIVSVSAGFDHTIGLKANGTVVSTGSNSYGQCNVSGWEDIVAVSAGTWYSAGLKADGTVVSTGSNNYGQCNVSGWSGIDVANFKANTIQEPATETSDASTVAPSRGIVLPDGAETFIHQGIAFGMTMEEVKAGENGTTYKQDKTSLMYELTVCDRPAYLTYTFDETGLINITYYITAFYSGEYNRYIEDDRLFNAKLTDIFGPSTSGFWTYKLNNGPGPSTIGVDESISTEPPFEADDLTYGAYYDMGKLSHTTTWSKPMNICHFLGNAGTSMHLLVFTPGQDN